MAERNAPFSSSHRTSASEMFMSPVFDADGILLKQTPQILHAPRTASSQTILLKCLHYKIWCAFYLICIYPHWYIVSVFPLPPSLLTIVWEINCLAPVCRISDDTDMRLDPEQSQVRSFRSTKASSVCNPPLPVVKIPPVSLEQKVGNNKVKRCSSLLIKQTCFCNKGYQGNPHLAKCRE